MSTGAGRRPCSPPAEGLALPAVSTVPVTAVVMTVIVPATAGHFVAFFFLFSFDRLPRHRVQRQRRVGMPVELEHSREVEWDVLGLVDFRLRLVE